MNIQSNSQVPTTKLDEYPVQHFTFVFLSFLHFSFPSLPNHSKRYFLFRFLTFSFPFISSSFTLIPQFILFLPIFLTVFHHFPLPALPPPIFLSILLPCPLLGPSCSWLVGWLSCTWHTQVTRTITNHNPFSTSSNFSSSCHETSFQIYFTS
ncbi:hypothetical protein KDRO_A07670 [Kluyveromyces lactis]|nr:hypothetical protein KDRO_A07670 [Kluyveromyces lactis]